MLVQPCDPRTEETEGGQWKVEASLSYTAGLYLRNLKGRKRKEIRERGKEVGGRKMGGRNRGGKERERKEWGREPSWAPEPCFPGAAHTILGEPCPCWTRHSLLSCLFNLITDQDTDVSQGIYFEASSENCVQHIINKYFFGRMNRWDIRKKRIEVFIYT